MKKQMKCIVAESNKLNMNTYAKLFSSVESELACKGDSVQIKKENFLLSVGGNSREVPVSLFIHLKGSDFFESLYFYCFQKIPSEENKKKAEQMTQKAILKLIADMGAFSIRGLYYTENPFGEIKPGIKGSAMKVMGGVKNSVALRKIAKKLPSRIQDKIRGTFS